MMPLRRQGRVLEWLRVTPTEFVSIDEGLEFMQAYMAEYDELPCDFADASLPTDRFSFVGKHAGLSCVSSFSRARLGKRREH